MASKRKLRLEIQQSNENGENGIPKIPRWYGQHAAITTKDITGSVMKIVITDSNGKQIAISIGENGSICQIRGKRNTDCKEKNGISINLSDQENEIQNLENTNQDDVLPPLQENVLQSKNSSANSSGNFVDVSSDPNLESVKVEEKQNDKFNSIEPSVSFEKVVDVISEGYGGSETSIEMLEVVDEFHQRIEKIKTEETELAGKFETVYISSVMPLGNCENSRPVSEQSTEPSVSIIESANNLSTSLLCRLCAIQRKDMVHLFEPSKAHENVIEKIRDCLSVSVTEADTLPQHVCRCCLEKLEQFHKFRRTVAEAEEQFFNTAKISEEQRKDTGQDNRTYLQCGEQNTAEESVEVILVDAEIPDVNKPFTASSNMENTESANDAELIRVEKDNAHSSRSEIIDVNSADEDVVYVGEEYNVNKKTVERFTYNIVKCRICGLFFFNAESCYKHSKSHYSKNYYPCAMCDSVFHESGASYLHSFSHTLSKLSPSLAASYTRQRTNYNLRSYTNRKKNPLLNSTKKITEKDNTTNVVGNLSTDNNRVECRICGMHFDNAENCFLHSVLHSSEYQYPCSMCNEIFTNKDDIHRHGQNHLVPKNPHRRAELLIVKKVSDINQQCDLIIGQDKFSNTEETMLEKDGTNHPDILCEEEEVESHTSYDPNDIDNTIECRICGMSFENTESCYLHSAAKHISGNQRPCSMCDKIFTNENDRLIHSLEHVILRNPSKKMKLCVKKVSDIDTRPSTIIGTHTVSNITENVVNNDVAAVDNDVQEVVQEHISDNRNDNIDMVKCRICGTYFGTAKSCYSHSWNHVSENQYPCCMCDAVFTNQKDSYRHSFQHIKRRKTKSRVELCIDQLSDMNRRSSPTMSTNEFSSIAGNTAEINMSNNDDIRGEHIPFDQNDNNDMVKCIICGMYFGTFKSCYLHSVLHVSGNQYPCSLCDTILTSENDWRTHSSEHVSATNPRRLKELFFKETSNVNMGSSPTISSISSLNHSENAGEYEIFDDNNILCDEEDKNETASSGNDDNEILKCRICGRYFGTRKGCFMHSVVHISEDEHPCSMCDQVFTNRIDNRIHSYQHSVSRKLQTGSEQLAKKKRLVERGESQSSNREEHHLNELRRRTGRAENIADTFIRDKEVEETENHTSNDKSKNDDELMACRICGAKNPNAVESYYHSAIHVKKSYYPCTICNKSFTLEIEAYKHNIDHVMIELKSKETAGMNTCNICARTYGSKTRLWFHEMYHDPKNIPNYCKKCDKTMASEISFYYHMTNIHNWPHTMENSCMECGKQFRTRAQLVIHKWSHVNTIYNCYFCDEKFVTEENLRLHKRNFCQSWEPADIYDCFDCGQKFLRKSSLEDHMKEHSDKDSHLRNNCPKTNSTEESENDYEMTQTYSERVEICS